MAHTNSWPTVLGVYLGHDLGACLLRGGEIISVIEEERLNRFKHGRPNDVAGLWPRFAGKFGYFPWASVCYCLEAGDLTIDDLDAIVIGDALWASAAADTIRSLIPIKDRGKIIFVNEPRGAVHHYHHALSAFMASPFEKAAVLVVDGDGNSDEGGYEAETGFLFDDRRGGHRLIFKNRYTDLTAPRSGIGWTYEQVTLLLGFANPKVFIADPGKTMGLSAYGRPRPEFDKPWVRHDGFKLDFSAFHGWLRESGYDSRLLSYDGGLATGTSNGISQYAKDLAFKVQSELEATMMHLVREMHRATGAENLCLAGGVALNSVANGIIAAQGPFKNIFVQPAANDGGQAVGLAYHGHLMLTTDASPMRLRPHANGNGARPAAGEIRPLRHAYGGRTYGVEEVLRLLDDSQLPFQETQGDDARAEAGAQDLAERRIIGWFQGGSEFGPRALGHRSILANPDREEMKDILNSRVKFRESFRPFAPSVLAERAGEVFELEGESPYMLLVAPVREEWKGRVQAITHVDGTARIQTVDKKVEPLYHALISAFERRTSIPLVLNTSFNLRGMPIVESPGDALQCFLLTDMDALYLGGVRVERPDPAYLFPEKSQGWEYIAGVEVGSGRRVLDCRDRNSPRKVSMEATPEFVYLFEHFDGACSLRCAYEKVYGGNGAAAATGSLKDVVSAVQSLARRGALQLRTGRMNFGIQGPTLHWWQPSVQKALESYSA